MAAEIAEKPQAEKPQHGLVKRKKRRVGIRIDMTPMVDVAFLLLIFFMVTTVFRRPLAMEVNMPEPGAKVEVPESNVMTIFVDQSENLTWRVGQDQPEPVTWDALPDLLEQGQQTNPDLIVLVKINRQARYDSMVRMMDDLDDAHIERFSLVPMTEQEQQESEEPR